MATKSSTLPNSNAFSTRCMPRRHTGVAIMFTEATARDLTAHTMCTVVVTVGITTITGATPGTDKASMRRLVRMPIIRA